MAGLFLVFVIVLVLIWLDMRKTAIILTIINILLCLELFRHHVTTILNISL